MARKKQVTLELEVTNPKKVELAQKRELQARVSEEQRRESAPEDIPPPPKVLIPAAIVEGVYSISDLKFGIDPESLTRTNVLVGKLSRPTLEQLITLHGEEVDDDTSDEAVIQFAQSLVQNDWYQILKGEIPMSVKVNHVKRGKAYKTKKKADATKGEKKRATLTQFKFSAKASNGAIGKLKGQAAVVASCLKKLGTTNSAELAAEVEKSGKLVSKKQDTKAVAGFYVSQWKAKGLVVGA